MLMVDAGYFAKVIEPTPPGLGIEGVREICSVSTCISVAPEAWVDQWRHNDFGWFNSIEDAWSVVPEGERARHRLFAYRIGLTRFLKGEPEAVVPSETVHPAPIPTSFVPVGFDAVSKSMDGVLGFECSPLSCNAMANELLVNAHCLFLSEATATAGAQAFSRSEPEPGAYYVVEVLEAQLS